MMTQNRHKPKAYAVLAVKRMIKLISGVKQDLSDETKDELRKLCVFAHNYNDEKSLHDIVKIMNNHRYQTGISFQVLSCYSKEHGFNTLEIRESKV
jgi:hypothetical protein